MNHENVLEKINITEKSSGETIDLELIEQKRSAEARAEQQYHVYKAELASLRERTAAELGELARRQAVVEGEAPRLAAAVAAAKAELVDMRISDARYAEIKTIPPAK